MQLLSASTSREYKSQPACGDVSITDDGPANQHVVVYRLRDFLQSRKSGVEQDVLIPFVETQWLLFLTL